MGVVRWIAFSFFAGSRWRLPSENASPTEQVRLIEFAGNDFLQAGSSYVSLEHPRLVIQSLQCSKLFRSAKLGVA